MITTTIDLYLNGSEAFDTYPRPTCLTVTVSPFIDILNAEKSVLIGLVEQNSFAADSGYTPQQLYTSTRESSSGRVSKKGGRDDGCCIIL